jgi:hypothetical protein
MLDNSTHNCTRANGGEKRYLDIEDDAFADLVQIRGLECSGADGYDGVVPLERVSSRQLKEGSKVENLQKANGAWTILLAKLRCCSALSRVQPQLNLPCSRGPS